ncbi:predicted protein [Pyrenophora tritici-repentis Pt-1C-BFP]|uniref:Uncharacterized protein n=1 Tax=Pyrenophora tritici-repentis (strain Pt-1C-BFP) TaxID=426418 RepID=B2WC28_PYRTR|nr:uncharacterized protein PTRG_07537 [Pyrenophora tritici-repentis Pt-1C-BFP]EDU50456.1 predicted protein [Pyrenophora tritici-repentis Pt-1C-BFP]
MLVSRCGSCSKQASGFQPHGVHGKVFEPQLSRQAFDVGGSGGLERWKDLLSRINMSFWIGSYRVRVDPGAAQAGLSLPRSFLSEFALGFLALLGAASAVPPAAGGRSEDG